MKVSIIIPAYNVEKYIRKCLNSAIKQKFEETQYEIIVINDCSKHLTLKIIKKQSPKKTSKSENVIDKSIESGANILGGCCGSNINHIKLIKLMFMRLINQL